MKNPLRLRLARRATRDALRLVENAATHTHWGSERAQLLLRIGNHLSSARKLLREAR